MSYPSTARSTGTRKPARILTLVLSTLLAGLGLLLGPLASSASAAEIPNAITDVKITGDPTKPLSVNSRFSMDATWAVPDSAQAGDTFTLSFPSVIVGYNTSFELKDPDGAVVGTCDVKDTAFTCTLSEYVNDRDNVHGTLTFTATAKEATDSEVLEFRTGNDVIIETDLPGEGGIGTGGGTWNQPKEPLKLGDLSDNGTYIWWTIFIPTDNLSGKLEVTDTSQLPVNDSSFQVRYLAPGQWDNGYKKAVKLDPSAYTYTNTGNGFTLTVPDPETAAGGMYIVAYSTNVPAGATDGTVYSNAAEWTGVTVSRDVTYQIKSGGTGEGEYAPRSISITKKVTGPAPADATYTFQLACVDADGTPLTGFPKELTVAADQTETVDGIPVGSTCTPSETGDKGAAEVTFDPADPITVTTESPATIAITATNTYPELGALSITKKVTGTGAEQVADATYTVNYRYTDAAGEEVTGSWTLAADGTEQLGELPAGTVVTLSEVKPVETTEISYGTAVFSGEGVKPTDAGATVTIGAGSTVAVTLTNPVTLKPPVSSPQPSSSQPSSSQPSSSQPPVSSAPISSTVAGTHTWSAATASSPRCGCAC